MAETTMTKKGQVVIPAAVRKLLGLERNTRFSVEARDGTIVLTPLTDDDWRSMRGSARGPSLTRWIEEEHRRERTR